MTYFRSRPWRSRSPWFSNRAGARRRGFRDDAQAPLPDEFQHGEDRLLANASEPLMADDIVLAETSSQARTERVLAAHVDVSGLLAIDAPPVPAIPIVDGRPAGPWPTPEDRDDGDSLLSRHSA